MVGMKESLWGDGAEERRVLVDPFASPIVKVDAPKDTRESVMSSAFP